MATNLRHDAEMLTIKEAAHLVGVSRATIRTWIREGKLGALVLPSGRVRIPASRLLREANHEED